MWANNDCIDIFEGFLHDQRGNLRGNKAYKNFKKEEWTMEIHVMKETNMSLIVSSMGKHCFTPQMS